MKTNKGIFEEIVFKEKEYPLNKHTYSLLPQQYNDALIQQTIGDIGKYLEELALEGKNEEVIKLTRKLREVVGQTNRLEYDMPLKAIHFRYDDKPIPLYPELFLSSPILLTNTEKEHNLFKALKYELQTADQAQFMVSFIRWSGLQLLIRAIEEFREKDSSRKLRILTSTYLKVTEPKALRRLLEIPNVETKVFDSGNVSFHTKAYLFERKSGLNTAIIGSSNLSYSALYTGHEWNVKLPDAGLPIYDEAKKAFDKYWEDPRAIVLSEELIDKYEQYYMNKKVMLVNPYIAASHADLVEPKDADHDESNKMIQPNAMQSEALKALEQTRLNGHNKGVVIAATGTGKTYLSAFDVQKFGARKLLFLAHRDEILENAKQTFISIFNNASSCGKLSGESKEIDKPFLFSTVQSLSRDETLKQFSVDYFDYIVVDEFHHAQASTYRKVIDYFKPKFLLGLTATPDRMDGRDVLELCDNNVVYEIRLRDALKEGLLTPFRYFGLSDPTVNYDEVSVRNGQYVEEELVRVLNTHERVGYVLDMIKKFGHDGDQLKALGFCATIEHAKYMSEQFNKHGIVAGYLTGENSSQERQDKISRLASDKDPLQIIFTVNIFNEGVDIPAVNMVLFLRPTESATIFIQQLGRGLRKMPGKEYVTVLDFIGNFNKSFVVPLALSGQHNHRAFDRDSLRVAVETEFADLPEGCFVDLEEISKQQILTKIENIRMDQNQLLIQLYNQFKKELGRSPEIDDFLYFEGAPSLTFFIRKYGSWVETKQKMEDNNDFDNNLLSDSIKLQIIQRVEKMLPIKWPYEFVMLSMALNNDEVTVDNTFKELKYRFSLEISHDHHRQKILRSMENLSEVLRNQHWSFGTFDGQKLNVHFKFRESMEEKSFRTYFSKRIEYGLTEFRRIYRPDIYFSSNKNVLLYQNYTRNDLMYLFESDARLGSWREGVSRVDNHYLLFVNLNKGEQVEDHLMYKDYFIDQRHFHWQSQNQTSHDSPRGQEYIFHKEKNIHIHLFVRKFDKMHGTTLPFTYLGEVDYVSSHGDKPMNIKWRLHQPIPDALLADFIR